MSGAKISGGGSTTTISDQMHILAATRALEAVGAIVGIQTVSNLLVYVLRGANARRGNADLWRLSIKPVRCAR